MLHRMRGAGLLAPLAVVLGRFADDGSVAVTDITGQPTEMGPGLVEAEPTNCPRG